MNSHATPNKSSTPSNAKAAVATPFVNRSISGGDSTIPHTLFTEDSTVGSSIMASKPSEIALLPSMEAMFESAGGVSDFLKRLVLDPHLFKQQLTPLFSENASDATRSLMINLLSELKLFLSSFGGVLKEQKPKHADAVEACRVKLESIESELQVIKADKGQFNDGSATAVEAIKDDLRQQHARFNIEEAAELQRVKDRFAIKRQDAESAAAQRIKETKQEFKYAVDDTKLDAHDYNKLIPTLQAELESRKCHQLLSCELGGLFHQLGLELVDLVTEIAVTHNLSEQKESFEKRCNSYMQKQAFYAQREAEINNPRAAAAGESMGE